MLLLAGAAAYDGRHARHQGLRRRRLRWHRFIPGAFVGGILIGIIEAMAQTYISTSLANSIVFGVLIIVLLVKPAGLLGKYVPEKV